jgi:hypothetical protein
VTLTVPLWQPPGMSTPAPVCLRRQPPPSQPEVFEARRENRQEQAGNNLLMRAMAFARRDGSIHDLSFTSNYASHFKEKQNNAGDQRDDMRKQDNPHPHAS